jgi:hypothetical protein
MEAPLRFSKSVAAKLQHYVYRLIDPRNGSTFYVGRGQGNRVFSHAAGQAQPTDAEDIEALKLKTIWKIKNAGFEVQHVIHRHGLNEDSAKEVEAALIDAYPGLTNIQVGYNSDRGARHAKQIISFYEAAEAVFKKHKLILINVNRSSEDTELYDAVRYAWKISPVKAHNCDYVLAVRNGMIIGVFEAEEWLPATTKNFPSFPTRKGRYGFQGHESSGAIKKLYLQKRVPDDLRKRGAANPIRYVNL